MAICKACNSLLRKPGEIVYHCGARNTGTVIENEIIMTNDFKPISKRAPKTEKPLKEENNE